MEILKNAFAGTMESSDVYIEIAPAKEGLSITLDSVVAEQFGEKIKAVVLDVLKENGVNAASVRVVDRGALECVIRARTETAILRGRENA